MSNGVRWNRKPENGLGKKMKRIMWTIKLSFSSKGGGQTRDRKA